MIFLPTTHFKVLQRTQDFPLDFQVVSRSDYIVSVANSNNETYSISPLVIEQRLRQGRIMVIAFPCHPSHGMDSRGADAGCVSQCRQCMLQANEEQIQFECALPAREILGPDSFGGEDGRHSPAAATLRSGQEHPWIKRGPGPLPENDRHADSGLAQPRRDQHHLPGLCARRLTHPALPHASSSRSRGVSRMATRAHPHRPSVRSRRTPTRGDGRVTLAQAHTKLLAVQQIMKDSHGLIKEALSLHRQIVRLGDREIREAIRALKRPTIDLIITPRRNRAHQSTKSHRG